MSLDLETAARWLHDARRVAVLTGAGISKESGVPTFRDALEGLWASYDPEELASVEGFRRNPARVWSWYLSRRRMIEAVEPNPAHHALVRLAATRPTTVITQNIDGLHQAAGSEAVLELHGNIRRYRCLARGHPVPLDDPHRHEEPPPCPACGSPARPDVVWFGETLPMHTFRAAVRATDEADLMLVIGTSGIVYPAAALPLHAADGGARTIEINPEPSELTPYLDLHLAGPAGGILPTLVDLAFG